MDATKMKAKRQGLRANFSKICGRIEQLLGQISLDEGEKLEIAGRAKGLIETKEKLDKISDELEEYLSPDEIEKEIEKSYDYDFRLEKVMMEIKKREKVEKRTNKVPDSDDDEVELDKSNDAMRARKQIAGKKLSEKPSVIKMPQIEIKPFAGDFQKWTRFWAQFENSVDRYPDIEKADKLQLLMELVEGTPLALISDLDITDDNYDAAVDKLQEKYGKAKSLKEKHVDALLALPPVRNMQDMKALRTLESEILSHTNAMRKLGLDVEIFFSRIKRKFPKELVFNFRQDDIDSKTVRDLLEFVRTEIQELEGWEEDENEKRAAPTKFLPSRKSTPTTISLSATMEPTNRSAGVDAGQRRKPFCFFCMTNMHWTRECMAELTLQDKRETLVAKGRCVRCFKVGHIGRECKFEFQPCVRCKGEHFLAMCPRHPYATTAETAKNSPIEERKVSATVVSITSADPETPQEVQDYPSSGGESDDYEEMEQPVPAVNAKLAVNIVSCDAKCLVILQTVTCWLVVDDKHLEVSCLIDSGSQRSFVKNDIVKLLKLPTFGGEAATVMGFGENCVTKNFPRVKLMLKNPDTNSKVQIMALSTDVLTGYRAPPVTAELQNHLDHCSRDGLKLAEKFKSSGGAPIDVIIGMDFIPYITKKGVKQLTESLIATETVFGWVIHGALDCVVPNVKLGEPMSSLVVTIEDKPNDELEVALKKLWSLDSIGVKEETAELTATDFDEQFRITLRKNGDRYSISLPWLENKKLLLQSNKEVAKKRLRELVRKLNRREGDLERYDQAISQYELDQHAERVKETEDDLHRIIYHLPHRGVANANRSTPLRIVFDASSHRDGELALNDCLFEGNNRNLDVVKILLNFRYRPWAFTADIKKAYLQIEVNEQDRDVFRYLWIDRNLPVNEQLLKPIVLRMTRVIFGMNSSPYLLRSVINEHAKQYEVCYPEAVETLTNFSYVDDIIRSCHQKQKMIKLIGQISAILKKAGFELHKIFTNDDDNDTKETSVLGIGWDRMNDELSIHIPKLSINSEPLTKRRMVRDAASIYDPLGWLAPLLIIAKMIIQETWNRRTGWDDVVPSDLELTWNRWVNELEKQEEWRVPRYLFQQLGNKRKFSGEFDLHFFADASPRAYGAVAYIVFENSEGITNATMIMSKFRVTPLKVVSLPRLELMAATMAVRLATYVRDNWISYERQRFFWTDSTITYFWIRRRKNKLPTFVQNRVSEIRERSQIKEWRHCPGEDNPADKATREIIKNALTENSIWWTGPRWLTKAKEFWPSAEVALPAVPGAGSLEGDIVNVVSINVEETPNIGQLININDFSSKKRLLRVTKNLIKFIRNCQKKENLTVAEENWKAELLWIKQTQRESYSRELKDLQKHGRVGDQSNLRRLRPFLDEEGVIRIQGRFQASNWTFNEKHPILLPKKATFTKLTIIDVHEMLLHAGVSSTLQVTRQQFWIPSGRQISKHVIEKCLVCTKYVAKTLQPTVAPLPEERLQMVPPFTNVGLDFAGPAYVKDYCCRTIKKAYFAIFTCATSRAVHFELVSSLETQVFIMALKRFIGRRGTPAVIFSDNASTFKKAAKDLKYEERIEVDAGCVKYAESKNIIWKRIVERAPWWGGFWERIVKSLKEPLRKIIGKATLSYEELETLIIEVEAVLNSRPLTTVSDDIDNLEIITPAHLVLGRSLIRLQPPPMTTNENLPLVPQAYLRRKLLNELLLEWKSAYVLQLRSLNVLDSKTEVSLEVGQIVIVNEKDKLKHMWPLARVIEVHPGRDGVIRSALIMTTDRKILRRSVNHLSPLEGTTTPPGGNVK